MIARLHLEQAKRLGLRLDGAIKPIEPAASGSGPGCWPKDLHLRMGHLDREHQGEINP
jgi:hypothetical protein